VLIIDNVHHADEGSLRLLQFLAGALRESRILLVGAYRDTEPGEPARAARIAAMPVEHAGLAIALRGFDRAEVRRFVEVASGTEPSVELTDALLRLSGGNPLYLDQLLQTEWAERALTHSALQLASSMDLQQGLIESIRGHVDALSAGTIELLKDSAVLGRDFDLGRLAVVSGLAREALLDRLDETLRARVLRKTRQGSYSYTHALVREVLYKMLSGTERAERHRLVAERLLAHYGDSAASHAAELAHHFGRALPGGDPERAIEFAIAAAEHDSAAGDHAAAAKSWSLAARALSFLRGHDAQRLQVQLGLARALHRAGQVDEAADAFLEATVLARVLRAAEPLAEAALGYAQAAGPASSERSAALLDEARSALAAAPGESARRLLTLLASARTTTH
jgi:predicted ATPase